MDSLDRVQNDLAMWVSSGVVAELIIEEMAEHDMPITLSNAKAVWLDALEHLPQLIRASVQALRDKQEPPCDDGSIAIENERIKREQEDN